MQRRLFLKSSATALLISAPLSRPVAALNSSPSAHTAIKTQWLSKQDDFNQQLLKRLIPANPVLPGQNDPASIFSNSQTHLYHAPIAQAKNSLGQHFVLHQSDNAVVVYDQAYQYIKRIKVPSNYGQLSDIAIDHTDRLYVVDATQHTLYQFSAQGQLQQTIGHFGLGTQGLNGPARMALDPDNNLHVIDKGNGHIKVFSDQGHYLFHYGSTRLMGKTKYFHDIAINQTGTVVLTDMLNQTLWQYDHAGHALPPLTATTLSGTPKTPKWLAFDTQATLLVVQA